MSRYKADYTKKFQNDIKKIKNSGLQERLIRKKDNIIENPYLYKLLRNVLKGKRRVHVGSHVLLFEINESDKTVVFHRFQKHDKAYR